MRVKTISFAVFCDSAPFGLYRLVPNNTMKRLYVHKSRFEEVCEGLRVVVDAQVIGDWLLPETTMGPMNNAEQLKVGTDMIAQARATGQDVQELG